MQKPEMLRALGLRDLVLFNLAAVVSIRSLTTAARIGPGSLTLCAAAAILFFVPLALVVARLNELDPVEGGIYAWTGKAFGEWHGFLCGWCYWLSNLFYFPNLLISGISIAFYTLGGDWAGMADSRAAVTAAALAILWIALLTNVVGLHIGKWTQNAGATATAAAGAAIIAAGLGALFAGRGATPIHVAPAWNWNSLNYWSQIAFAFGGLELGAVMSGEIRDPRRTVRRAAYVSAVLIGGFYILGTLAVLALLPPERVNIITGLAQAADAAGARTAVGWLIAIGILGQFGAWSGGAARLAFAIGLDRYLPPVFSTLHPRWRTPHWILLSQGAACTLFLLMLEAGETLRAAYQLLVDMTVVSYFIPFLYLFATAWKRGMKIEAACGSLVTAVGIVFTFVPPEDAKSAGLFEAKLMLSIAVLVVSGWWVYRRRQAAMLSTVAPPGSSEAESQG